MPLKSTCEKIKKTYLFYLKIREWALANNDQVLVLNWFDRKHKARKRPLRHIYCGRWWKSALFLLEQTSRWYHAIEYQWTLCSNWNIDWKIVNKNSKFKIFRKNCKKKIPFFKLFDFKCWPGQGLTKQLLIVSDVCLFCNFHLHAKYESNSNDWNTFKWIHGHRLQYGPYYPNSYFPWFMKVPWYNISHSKTL